MAAQTILPFKLEMTRDEITAYAGLAMFGEFVHAMGVPGLLDRESPGPGSGAGYRPSQFALPLLLMLHGGGRTLEDLRQIRMDQGLCELLHIDRIPSSDATGDWLRRMGCDEGIGDSACGPPDPQPRGAYRLHPGHRRNADRGREKVGEENLQRRDRVHAHGGASGGESPDRGVRIPGG